MDASTAFTTIRDLLTANVTNIQVFYPNEDNLLPDTPVAFAYVDFLTDPAFIATYGGGLRKNVYRNRGTADIYVFVPKGSGLKVATDQAETIAAILRSYRSGDFTAFGATVFPGGDGAALTPSGLRSPVNNYWAAICQVDMFFDQVG